MIFMARNFREKNKYLYNVQHESASYFMNRMVKLLSEEGNDNDDANVFINHDKKAKIRADALNTRYNYSPTDQDFSSDQEAYMQTNNEIDKLAQTHSILDLTNMLNNAVNERDKNLIKEAINRKTLTPTGISDANSHYEFKPSWIPQWARNGWDTLVNWNTDPNTKYMTWGIEAALAAGVGYGVWYLYNKYKKNGEITEEDKKIAEKMETAN